MKIIAFFQKKIVLFIIQITILSLLIYIFNYKFVLNLQLFPPPSDTTQDQIAIIEFLATYLMYEDVTDAFFIYICWSLISIIPVIIYVNYIKALKMNLITYITLNFFLYIFLNRHVNDYFRENFSIIFIKTYITGIWIIVLSIEISLILRIFKKPKSKEEIEDLHNIANKIKTICPNCGTEFNSIPQYCYNCNKQIIEEKEENVDIKQ
ncbi:MAG: hypothetical protein ACFFHD_14310 [Promethearchaeota archaeon]